VNLIVIDTGVMVAGVFWRSEPHQCLKAWLCGQITLVVSESIFDEYERVLSEVKREHDFSTDIEAWLRAIRKSAYWIVPCSLTETVCRDPKDDHMIEAALASGARTIIARDADLTVLKKPFGIRILTPRAWLATLSRANRHKLR
jgi:uncharacterized protein